MIDCLHPPTIDECHRIPSRRLDRRRIKTPAHAREFETPEAYHIQLFNRRGDFRGYEANVSKKGSNYYLAIVSPKAIVENEYEFRKSMIKPDEIAWELLDNSLHITIPKKHHESRHQIRKQARRHERRERKHKKKQKSAGAASSSEPESDLERKMPTLEVVEDEEFVLFRQRLAEYNR